jgi:L-fuculose-phosphate aldolase
MREWEARELLCEIGRRVWQRQYVAGTDGNFSIRLENNIILATPTLVSKGFMQPEDMVKLDLEGNILEGRKKPTSELYIHLLIYKERGDVGAVVHAHPPHATAYAVVGAPIPKCILPEVEIFVGEVPVTEYAMPGSREIAERLKTYLPGRTTFLLGNHGAVTVGKDLIEAYHRLEIIDQYCRILLLARQLGEPRRLTREQMKHIYALKEKTGAADSQLPCDTCTLRDTCLDGEAGGGKREARDGKSAEPDTSEPAAAQEAPTPQVPNSSTSQLLSSSVIPAPDPQLIERIVREVFERLR